MKIRKPLAALLATATMAALAATSGAATALAIENPTVTVHLDQTGCTENTNNTNCQITHGSTGFLYGLTDDGVSSDTTLNGLSLDSNSVLVGKSPDGVQHPNGDVLNTTDQWKRNGGGEIQVYMKEAYKNFPYVAYGDGGMDGDYVPKLKEMVTKFNTKYPDLKDDIVWIPFNEPDISDANYYNLTNYNSKYDSVRTKFFEDWNKAVEAIRSVYPQARIGGPNNSAYSDRFYRDFFQNAKEHGTVPDVVTWHELGSGFGSYLSNFQKWKTLEKDVLSDYAPPENTGLKQGQTIKVSINEYAWKDQNGKAIEQVKPGRLLQYVARFEKTGAQGALPYWYPAGDLDWLVTKNNQVTGSYWLYYWYGLMKGDLLKVDLPDENGKPQVLASYNKDSNQTQILLGGSNESSYSTTLNLSALPDKYPNGAHVTIYATDSTAPANLSNVSVNVPAASDGPYVVAEQDLSIANGQASLPLNNLKGDSAYYAVIAPATSQGKVSNSTVEAEYARRNGTAKVTYGNASGYSGTGYVEGADATASSDFFVDSKKNGYNEVMLRYSAPKADGQNAKRTVTLKINPNENSARNDAQELTLQLPETKDANTWQTAKVRIYMPLGLNQITVEGYGTQGMLIDSVSTASADDSSVTRYEAEDSSNTFNGSAKASADNNASNSRIVGNVGNGANNWFQFNKVTVPEDGNYTLTIGYAQWEYTANNTWQIVNRWADMSVNGETSKHLVFANTRGWSNFWTTSVRVNLKKGENTIRFGNANTGTASESGKASGWAPNFDYIQVAPTVDSSSVKYTTADGSEIKSITSLTAKANGLKDGVLTLTEGDSVDVDVNIKPINATDATLVWASSDSSVATAEEQEDADGIATQSAKLVDSRTIHALKAGETTFTVTPAVNAENGVSATFKVIVTAKEPEPVSADKSKLQAAVDEAGKLDEKDYTADSWKVFTGQLESAKKVLADENATQDDVDSALKTLKDAQSGLVKADIGSTGGSTSGGSSAGNTGNTGNIGNTGNTGSGGSHDASAASTGAANGNDSANGGQLGLVSTGAGIALVAGVAALLAVAGAVIAVLRRRNAI
ncbi:hypothetical protein [Bifidobacterium sp.]|uniref:hypothetical protein n=1 Tax=Bifidobacterium sp. TaxID=41200 RepID=UPI0040298608